MNVCSGVGFGAADARRCWCDGSEGFDRRWVDSPWRTRDAYSDRLTIKTKFTKKVLRVAFWLGWSFCEACHFFLAISCRSCKWSASIQQQLEPVTTILALFYTQRGFLPSNVCIAKYWNISVDYITTLSNRKHCQIHIPSCTSRCSSAVCGSLCSCQASSITTSFNCIKCSFNCHQSWRISSIQDWTHRGSIRGIC